jgi:sirohydrochlorin cobaltochelatase
VNEIKPPKNKLILLAHGSRDENWRATFESGLNVINEYVEQDACLAYMEMASPSLEQIVAEQYAQKVRYFDVLPLFFAAGRHLLHDVPAEIESLLAEHQDVEINLLNAVGLQEEFWQMLGAMIAREHAG